MAEIFRWSTDVQLRVQLYTYFTRTSPACFTKTLSWFDNCLCLAITNRYHYANQPRSSQLPCSSATRMYVPFLLTPVGLCLTTLQGWMILVHPATTRRQVYFTWCISGIHILTSGTIFLGELLLVLIWWHGPTSRPRWVIRDVPADGQFLIW